MADRPMTTDIQRALVEAGVRVKPLGPWIKYTHYSTDDDNGPLEGVRMALEAWRVWPFRIIRQRGPYGRFILDGTSDEIGHVLPTLEQAKAAAQADYEARVLAALTHGDDHA